MMNQDLKDILKKNQKLEKPKFDLLDCLICRQKKWIEFNHG